MAPLQRLSGHKDSVLCCMPVGESTQLLSSSEDGSICVFDVRIARVVQRHVVSANLAVPSLALSASNAATTLYCCAATQVHELDFRNMDSGGTVMTMDFNNDEINCIASHPKGYLAAADDSGEVKVMDVKTQKLHKTLKGVHSNICTSVLFQAHRPWEVISGGLDAQMVRWDFGSGRHRNVWQMRGEQSEVPQVCNPPLIHSLAANNQDIRDLSQVVAAACGDGCVALFDLGGVSQMVSKKGTRLQKPGASGGPARPLLDTAVCVLREDQSGHSGPVNHVCFPDTGNGAHLLSGGNDGKVCLWNWAARLPADSYWGGKFGVDQADDAPQRVAMIGHGKKINCLATSSLFPGRVYVADVGKRISIYSLERLASGNGGCEPSCG